MDKGVFDLKNISLLRQRNIALLAMVVMGIALVFSLAILFTRGETTIIVPSSISGQYQYKISSKGGANLAYLEDMAVATAYNFLNVSPETFAYNKLQILRLTAPSRRSFVLGLLERTKALVKARNISTAFRLRRVLANAKYNKVKIFGTLSSYLGTSRVSVEQKAYEVSFDFIQSTLLLVNFKEIPYADAS